MYEILHADMYHENRCIHEQSTARWDALLAGLTVVSTRCFGTRPLPLSAAPPSANVGKASHLAPVMRALRTRAGNPRARSESTRASSQRVHRVRRAEHRSEGRRSRGAWNVRAKASARARRARAPRVRHGRRSGRRTELGSACVAMVVARGTCALRRRTSRPSCARSEPRARKPRARSQPTRASSQRVHRVRRAEHRSDGRAGPGLRAERARGGERARVKPASCTEPGVPSTSPTAAGRGFLVRGTCSWR
jgi:hypothetical protein